MANRYIRAADAPHPFAKAVDDSPLIVNFRPVEFRCKCGNKACKGYPTNRVTYKNLFGTATYLQALRNAIDRPIVITSGYRCGLHPAEANKTHPGSHQQGKAVDIRTESKSEAKQLAGIWIDMLWHHACGVGYESYSSWLHIDWGHRWANRPAQW